MNRDSAAIQSFMQDQSDLTGNGESIDQRPKDIHCPQMGGKEDYLNSYRETCVIRVTAAKVQACCRKCEEGQKIAQELNVVLTGVKVKGICSSTGCIETPADGYKTCERHKAEARARYEKRKLNPEWVTNSNAKRNERRKLKREKEK